MTRRVAVRTAAVYAAAVVASAVYQTARPGLPEPRAGDGIVYLAPQTAAGPTAGPPVRLAFEERGAGPAVVLLHGSPGAVADFRHLMPHLDGRFRVLVPDLPGFGRSARWLPDYSVLAHARYVLDWLDAVGVPAFQVVGFSQGGGVALHLADLAPDRVKSVTLVGGIGIQEGEGSGSYALEHAKYAAMLPTVVAGPELVPHFGLLGSRSFRWTFYRNFRDTDQRPLRGVLERLRPPLLVLHGRHDALVPAWAAVEHHRLVPGSELHLFADTHFMLFDAAATARLSDPLTRFLVAHAGPTAVRGMGSVVAYGPPQPLPESKLWPPVVQVAVPAAAAVLSPVAAALGAGLMSGTDRGDWFAGWLGVLLGGIGVRVRRPDLSSLYRTLWWPAAAAGLVAGSALLTAAAGWPVVVVAAAVWYCWRRTRGAIGRPSSALDATRIGTEPRRT